MPMDKIRKRFFDDNFTQGPAKISELETVFKYVIMHPTGTKEEAEKIAAKITYKARKNEYCKNIIKILL